MKVLQVRDHGSFYVGGKRHTVSGCASYKVRYLPHSPEVDMNPNGDYQVGQMYVEYMKLVRPRTPYPVLMCHGGGLCGVCWETTPDGRSGWKNLFLEEDYDIYVSDAVERGRASWARYPEINPGPPVFRSYSDGWADIFRFGRKYPETYEGLLFPIEAYDTFMKQSIPRWTTSNEWIQAAYDEYVASMKDGCILMCHSQGSAFVVHAAMKHPENVRALILVEPSVAPDVAGEDVSPLKDIPHLFLWGDFLGADYYPLPWWAQVAYLDMFPRYVDRLRSLGAAIEWVDLPSVGIRGNSHMMMMDRNNAQVAALIFGWLKSAGF